MAARFVLVILATGVPLLAWPLAAQSLRPKAPFGTPAVCAAGAASSLVRVRFDPPPPGGDIGPLMSCDSSGVTLAPFGGFESARAVPATRIRSLDVRQRWSTSGAIWGGAIGGVVGLTFGLLNSHLCPTNQFEPTATNCRGNIAVTTAIGLGAGLGVGWFFGRGLPRWKVIYKAYPGDS